MSSMLGMDPDSGHSGGHVNVGMDADEFYTVLRKAIEDAMLNVLGTLVLVGIGFVFVWVGAQMFFAGPDPTGAIAGAVIILIGFYLAAVSLGVIRPVQTWL